MTIATRIILSMRLTAEIQFNPWDKVYNFEIPEIHKGEIRSGDYVIVDTKLGTEIGKVVGVKELSDEQVAKFEELKPVVRKATTEDIDKVIKMNKEKEEAMLDFKNNKTNLSSFMFESRINRFL